VTRSDRRCARLVQVPQRNTLLPRTQGKVIRQGWSQPHDAAARLHAAGYIIVDQNDEPLPLPEQYTHLMRGAERARLVALNYFIEPSREAGMASVTIGSSNGRFTTSTHRA
jgi:hypothetical protein